MIEKIDIKKLSSETIKKKSVLEITKSDLYDGRGKPIEGGLIDDKIKHNKGHLKLESPIIDVKNIAVLKKVLERSCIYCSKSLREILHPFDKKSIIDNDFNMKEKIKTVCPRCGSDQPIKYFTNQKVNPSILQCKFKDKPDIFIPNEYIYRLLSKLSQEDLQILGFSSSHPRDLIKYEEIVVEYIIRPPLKFGSGNNQSQDHLTLRYLELMKANKKAKDNQNTYKNGTRDTFNISLAHEVAGLMDNSGKNFATLPVNSVVPHTTFGQRIRGKIPKESRIRLNLCARRVKASGRSVIIPDPVINLDEIGFPRYIAEKITYPVKVHDRNILELQKLLESNVYPNIIFIERSGIKKKARGNEFLELNDIVYRNLIDGDWVILNRQPSLHKYSMMGHKIVVTDEKCFRLNPNVTEPYNADFDGDEMNCHVPQSIATTTEIETLITVKNHAISSGTSEPNVKFIQDNILNAYLSSKDGDFFWEEIKNKDNKQIYFNSISERLPKYYDCVHESPVDLFIKTSNKKIDKKNLKKILIDLYNSGGNKEYFRFMEDFQKFLTFYSKNRIFSVGPDDGLASEKVKEQLESSKKDLEEYIKNLKVNIHNKKFKNRVEFEKKVLEDLSKMTNEFEKVVKENDTTRLIDMLQSKGKPKNIMQMKGYLGQQMVNGGRINIGLDDRNLVHFKKYDEDVQNRGFIPESFSSGMSPIQYFFHAAGGREGIIEQALQTGETGYIQAVLVKNLEEIIVNHFNVSLPSGQIVETCYGGDNFNPENVQSIDVTDEIMMSRYEYELKNRFSIKDLDVTASNVDKKKLDSNYQKMLENRKCMRDKFLKREKTNIRIDEKIKFHLKTILNIDTILEDLLMKTNEINKDKQTNLDPNFIMESYETLLERVFVPKYKYDLTEIRFLLFAKASPKKIMLEYRFTQEIFKQFIEKIETTLISGIIPVGEPVGIVSAQSIGEPSTQLTLNSFHFAGSGRSQGIPRLLEIIHLLKDKEQTANLEVTVKKPYCFYENDVEKISESLSVKYLKSIVTGYDVMIDTGESSKNEVLLHYRKLLQEINKNYTKRSDIIISLSLMQNTNQEYLEKLYDNLNVNENIQNILIDIEKNKVYFEFDVENFIGDNEYLSLDLSIKKKLENIIQNTTINGFENIILSEVIQKKEVTIVDDEISENNVYAIKCSGTNLKSLIKNQSNFIDIYNTFSSDIHETYNLLGLEAVNNLMVKEIFSVLSDFSVEDRHIQLLVNFLSVDGNLRTTKSNDFFKRKYINCISKSTFESPLEVLNNAAVFGETVDVKNTVNTNIFLGQPASVGTGFSNNILYDDEKR